MYYPDKSRYRFGGYPNTVGYDTEEVLSIGWLEKGHPYNTGEVDARVLEKIAQIMRREQVHLMRGFYFCTFCDKVQMLESDTNSESSIIMGMGQIWIPSVDASVIYAAPTLVYHYIQSYKYKPPEEFIESVLAFNLSSSWSGESEFRRIREYLADKRKE